MAEGVERNRQAVAWFFRAFGSFGGLLLDLACFRLHVMFMFCVHVVQNR